jgi:hypothetical protein
MYNRYIPQPDGSYRKNEGGEGTNSQERLYQYFRKTVITAETETAPVTLHTEETPANAPVADQPVPKKRTGFLKRLFRRH